MNTWQKIRLLLILIATCALPAAANNPPQPDGIFSVLLIFPVVLIGMRLADARPEPKAKRRPLLTGLLLTLAFLFTLAGTEIGGLGLLVILIYGIYRGAQILQRGKSRKAWAIGAVVILWVLFAGADYFVSLSSAPLSSVAMNEAGVVTRLRVFSSAETSFANQHSGNAEAQPVYAPVAKLQQEGLLDSGFEADINRHGYRLGEIMEPSGRHFIFYAVPVQAQRPEPRWRRMLPGSSLFPGLFRKKESGGTGVRSFAVDETGIIRWSVRSAPTPVTRIEAENWEKL
ncbi:MAG TPA: hypothetical protein VFB10_11960 [Candidatus Dormibacteraeota bacterium]|nr:hypothetical protein [Candidatus Dormibacteraeota bacterium]